jgi:hypothetical protein
VKRDVMLRVKEKRKYLCGIQRRKNNWISSILGKTALLNALLKLRYKGWEEEDKDVSSY